jgi:L-threonylcarbamoyladenylate synthase
MVGELCGPFPAAYRVLAGEFWPGPLTLVLPASSRLPDFLLGPGRTVAVRIPPLPWLRALVREISQPLTATSANLSGEEAVAEADQVIAIFGGKVEIVVDGGRTPGGGPSTVVDLSSPEPRVLREGAVSAARIRAALLP